MTKKYALASYPSSCFTLLLALFIGLMAALPLNAATLVPEGNRHASQPPIPGGSVKRTKGSSFELKYKKIRNLLAKDRKLMKKIKSAAQKFNIDPIHIIAALVGEHTYNVDAKDRLQSYYVKALAYLGQDLTFRYKGTKIVDLIKQSDFAKCNQYKRDYSLWSCRERIWNERYRGKNHNGQKWPNNRLGAVFFQPLYAGQTFGLGQLNPLTALKLNDMVRARAPREPKLSVKKAPQIYNRIMNPDSTLLYMAAALRNAIDAYRTIADMDISKNPGITATLYNLGNVTVRAANLKAKNKKRAANNQSLILPKENYYGWLINQKLSDLKSIL